MVMDSHFLLITISRCCCFIELPVSDVKLSWPIKLSCCNWDKRGIYFASALIGLSISHTIYILEQMSIRWWGMSVQGLNKTAVRGSSSERHICAVASFRLWVVVITKTLLFIFTSFSRPISWKRKTKLSGTQVACKQNYCL